MNRSIEPEWLDELPLEDPGASGSRRDLRRLNRWMGHVRIVAKALTSLRPAGGPVQIVELGAGDGTFLLKVAHALGPKWSGTRVVLLDRQRVILERTLLSFTNLGWEPEAVMADVLDWRGEPASAESTIFLANLFLHHFDSEQLQELLSAIARRSCGLIALEPRRSEISLLCSHLVWLIGCNRVTRHDAPTSVRAGFRGNELSELWPNKSGWVVRERAAGLFSHLFMAQVSDRNE